MRELRALLAQPCPLEVHLVLSTTTREEEAEEMIRQFSVLALHSLLFTKLDESGSLASLFNLAVRSATPLSYLTTGQRVPEDVEVATAERIIDLVWHGFWG
jgi:flagellar biosynthesis protein FlhF